MKVTTKAQLLEAISYERARLEKKIARLTPKEIVFPACMGDWSVKDLMAHLVDWEQRCIGWYEAGTCGEIPVTPEPGYKWNQLPALNEKYYQLHKNQPLADVQTQFGASFQQIVSLLETIPAEELEYPGFHPWTGKGTLLGFFKANTSSHYRWAITQIRPMRIRTALAERSESI